MQWYLVVSISLNLSLFKIATHQASSWAVYIYTDCGSILISFFVILITNYFIHKPKKKPKKWTIDLTQSVLHPLESPLPEEPNIHIYIADTVYWDFFCNKYFCRSMLIILCVSLQTFEFPWASSSESSRTGLFLEHFLTRRVTVSISTHVSGTWSILQSQMIEN